MIIVFIETIPFKLIPMQTDMVMSVMTSLMMLLKTPILTVTVLGITRILMMIMITGQIQLKLPVELILEIAPINP